eukprot:CAMPEP_0114363664 /NCGR_PEP_ID=MMETSP0101-20121206/26794_1 /TAXON_ID=38822 ORGANISM="Pteridomonas danica, Strain PT" /NCGR_SAMPLE_ID=MMETSP0101 /ASSEMBLY_ACC=CAM_ASM_000211 /LENGTH=290 /DNA_ID=CAMNT_0001510535 /DNA_START=64 /DNA_END=933 /DNA_ORIENTATION=+
MSNLNQLREARLRAFEHPPNINPLDVVNGLTPEQPIIVDDDICVNNSVDGTNWACGECTYLNHQGVHICEMCGSRDATRFDHSESQSGIQSQSDQWDESLTSDWTETPFRSRPTQDQDPFLLSRPIHDDQDPFIDGMLQHIAGGAAVGSFIGGSSATLQGRNAANGVMGGAIAGALGGAMLGLVNNMDHDTDPIRDEAQRQAILLDLMNLVGGSDPEAGDPNGLEALFDNHETRTIPASEETIDTFPTRAVTKVDETDACAVCMEPMIRGEVGKSLLCAHFFHAGCIDKW